MIGLGDDFTKYHGKREKIAVINVAGKGAIKLGLSDTQRCARSIDSARSTLRNLAGDALAADEVDGEAQKLHAHCKVLTGMRDDPQPRRA